MNGWTGKEAELQDTPTQPIVDRTLTPPTAEVMPTQDPQSGAQVPWPVYVWPKTAALRGYKDALQKLGLSKTAGRLEDAIRAGEISYDDLTPETKGWPEAMRKSKMRQQFHAPGEVAPEALARKREMARHLFQAQMAAPNTQISPRVHTAKQHVPGAGPAAMTAPGTTPMVYVPESSGQFLRTLGDAGLKDRIRAIGGTLPTAATDDLPAAVRNRLSLVAQEPVDHTLNLAVLQHELGEASESVRGHHRGTILPHASHLGVEPIVRENLINAGDPEAVGHMRRVRAAHPEDAHVARLLRSVGHTPDRPIPLDGRQQAALERLLGEVDPATLSQATRQRALVAAEQGARVPYVPEEVAQALANAPEARAQFQKNVKGKGLMKTLLSHGPDFYKKQLAPINRFLRTGR